MFFQEISSKDNPLIKLACSLKNSAKIRRENGLFIIEGLRICKDAEENNIRFDKLIVTDTAYKKYEKEILKFAENSDNCYLITENLFDKISDTNSPQGIIAIAKMPKKVKKINIRGRYIALENLQDPANIGAIARSAEAFGISGIVISSDSCDPYSPKVLRASMGTLLRIPLFFTDDLSAFISNNSLRSFACVVSADAEKITNVAFSDGDIIIIGNEANGITDKTAKEAYNRITIPMSGKAESLNAAAAAAVAIWEMTKNGRENL